MMNTWKLKWLTWHLAGSTWHRRTDGRRGFFGVNWQTIITTCNSRRTKKVNLQFQFSMTHAINGKIGGKKIHWEMANIFFFIISNYTQKYMKFFFGLFFWKGAGGVKTPIFGSKRWWEVFSRWRKKTWLWRRELHLKWKKHFSFGISFPCSAYGFTIFDHNRIDYHWFLTTQYYYLCWF